MSEIGIFRGKQAEYNKQILEILFTEGPLSPWELAKLICHMRNPKIGNEVAYYKTQKIYSVITRKKGRLEDLERKQYVERKNGKFELTLKGAMAILICKPEINPKMHPSYLPSSIQKFNFPKKMKVPFLGITINGKIFESFLKDALKSAIDPDIRLSLAKKVKKLLDEGVDMDKIDEDKLMVLTANEVVEMLQNKLKEKTKGKNNYIWETS